MPSLERAKWGILRDLARRNFTVAKLWLLFADKRPFTPIQHPPRLRYDSKLSVHGVLSDRPETNSPFALLPALSCAFRALGLPIVTTPLTAVIVTALLIVGVSELVDVAVLPLIAIVPPSTTLSSASCRVL